MNRTFQQILNLTRLNRPIGIELLFYPCLWGMILALRFDSESTSKVFKGFVLFLIGSIVMRTAGCIFNDYVDRDIDAQVKRTQTRPFACKSVSKRQGLILILGFLTLGLFVFLQLPYQAQRWALIGGLLMVVYPFAKRWTHYPQIVLGMTFNTGILIGWSFFQPKTNKHVWILYGLGILWTLIYDTIYAFQDVEDDARMGVGSTAIVWKSHPKTILGLLMGGFVSGWSFFFPSVMVLGFIGLNIVIIKRWNPYDPISCREAFTFNRWIGLWSILSLLP